MNNSALNETRCRWTGPIYYWNFMTLGILSLNFMIVMGALTNIIVFLRWRNKEPFLLYHISLAFAEILIALFQCFGPTSRLLDETMYSKWPFKVTGGGYSFVAHLPNLILTAVGIDRWVSVEYPVFYINHISRRTVVAINMALWGANCTFWTGVFGFRSQWVLVSCSKGSYVYYGELWLSLSYYIQFYGCLIIMGLVQLRLMHIAIRAKVRLIGRGNFITPHTSSSLVTHEAPEQQIKTRNLGITSGKLLRRMMRTVAAGSALILTAVVGQGCGAILYGAGQLHGMTAPIFMSYLILSLLRDLLPFHIYFAFYPNYRACFRDLLSDWGRKVRCD